MANKSGYNVVFEGTGKERSNFLGVRTYSTWESREEYEKDKADPSFSRDRVVAEGVTPERAVEIIEQQDIAYSVLASIESSTRGGVVQEGILAEKLSALARLRPDDYQDFVETHFPEQE